MSNEVRVIEEDLESDKIALDYGELGFEQLLRMALSGDAEAGTEVDRRVASTRTTDFQYDARHLAGLHDQSTHGSGGGATGYGLGAPTLGIKRGGAGDIRISAADVEAFKGGSLDGHIVDHGDGTFSFDAETQARHDKIVADAVLHVPSQPPGTAVATLQGGGSRTGKSSFEDQHPEMLPDGKTTVKVDVDAVKTTLPGYDPKAPGFVHEESSYLGKRIQAAAVERNQNLHVDQTGNSSWEARVAQVETLKANDYQVNAIYMTMPLATSLKINATASRVVPVAAIMANHRSVSQIVPRAASTGLFDSLQVWDTRNKGAAVQIFSSENGGILDVSLWDEFVAKGNAP
jgi:hypothetical protein